MSPGAADRAPAELGAIWTRHRAEILAAVGALEDAVVDGLAGRLDDVRRERAGSLAHQLAGSAGTFGFPAAGAAARELEEALSGARAPAPEQFPRLADLVVALRTGLGAGPG